MTRLLPLLLALLVVGGLAAGSLTSPPALVLARAQDRVLVGGAARTAVALPPELDTPAEREGLAHATPDDLARGILTLAALPPDDSRALSPPQRASLLAAAARGEGARARRDAIRTEVRRAETAWLDSGAALWQTLPRDAQDAIRAQSTPTAAPVDPRPILPPGSPLPARPLPPRARPTEPPP